MGVEILHKFRPIIRLKSLFQSRTSADRNFRLHSSFMKQIILDSMKFAISLLAIIDPLAALPIFLLTLRQHPHLNIAKLNQVVVTATIVALTTSLILGQHILNFFGISIASFTVAGGILIFGMAISMMQAHSSDARIKRDEINVLSNERDVGILPLAIPLLSGPGAMSMAIVQSKQLATVGHWIGAFFVILFIAGIIWLVLEYAKPIADKMGQTGLNVFTRIMGLILLAISIEMLANGIKELIPAFKG